MSRHLIAIILGFLAVATARLEAGAILIPNPSFEVRSDIPTDHGFNIYVDVDIQSWQKADKPDWYNESSGGTKWFQLVGAFKNTTPYIDNCDGEWAIWLFAMPEVELFQDYDSIDYRNQPPTHDFDVTYEVGKSYDLTVGVLGGGGNMLEGVPLELSLYCRDDASNVVVVASTTVTNSAASFPNRTHLFDYSVHVPTVKATDFWANRKIGIRILSTVSYEMRGGYWDLDNVRLRSVIAPTFNTTSSTNDQIALTLQGEPGFLCEVLTATSLSIPASNWVSVSTITNTTGTIPFIDTNSILSQRFYRISQRPSANP